MRQSTDPLDDYTFKKSTCERYDIRWGSYGWATFTIDENGGLFNCQSDYGDYNYAWPKHGRESFKHFLIEITRSPDYLLGKVAKQDCFNLDKALKQWKPRIIEMRRDRDITADQAREAWDFIEGLDGSGSVDFIQSEIYSNSALSAISDEPWYDFEIDPDYPHRAKVFANKIMPMFAEILKKEIEVSK